MHHVIDALAVHQQSRAPRWLTVGMEGHKDSYKSRNRYIYDSFCVGRVLFYVKFRLSCYVVIQKPCNPITSEINALCRRSSLYNGALCWILVTTCQQVRDATI